MPPVSQTTAVPILSVLTSDLTITVSHSAQQATVNGAVLSGMYEVVMGIATVQQRYEGYGRVVISITDREIEHVDEVVSRRLKGKSERPGNRNSNAGT